MRRLDQVDTGSLLVGMGSLRREIARVREQLQSGSVPEQTLQSLIATIDRSAHLITGDDAFFGLPA